MVVCHSGGCNISPGTATFRASDTHTLAHEKEWLTILYDEWYEKTESTLDQNKAWLD